MVVFDQQSRCEPLYLLNPSGVLFGKKCKAECDGIISAVQRGPIWGLLMGQDFMPIFRNNSTLTSAPIAAFGFLSNTPAPITIQESPLQVPMGKTLSVVGGDINITNNSAGYLYAPGEKLTS